MFLLRIIVSILKLSPVHYRMYRESVVEDIYKQARKEGLGDRPDLDELVKEGLEEAERLGIY